MVTKYRPAYDGIDYKAWVPFKCEDFSSSRVNTHAIEGRLGELMLYAARVGTSSTGSLFKPTLAVLESATMGPRGDGPAVWGNLNYGANSLIACR